MTILQLDPPIPVTCPEGNGLAWLVIDYGTEHHLLWTIAIDETGEIWTFDNTRVRATKNITMGRGPVNKKHITNNINNYS